jgi:acetate kinase
MKILVVNVGSTSYKCRLIDMNSEIDLAKGGIEKVGSNDAIISYTKDKVKIIDNYITSVKNHREAVKIILDYLLNKELGVINSLEEISGIGFKTIQAGEKNGTVLLTKEVTDAMESYASLAPAHNPPYLNCIYYFKEILPTIPLIGVFEPGFHTEIPEYARVFGVPYEWYEKYQVKKYGYHGASFRYVTAEVIKRLKLDINNVKLICCHLGGSSSICAFKNGKSIDTSMSFTPQSGLIQSNRVGDIDPFVLPYIMEKKNISLNEALKEVSNNGGLFGISGAGKDMRDVWMAADKGDKRSNLAIEKFVYDIVRYIGSYFVLMEGTDVIAFSGGIGQFDWRLRKMVIDKIAFLGVEIDDEKNKDMNEGIKTKDASKIKVMTVSTNEEIIVARETVRIIQDLRK